MSKRPRLWPVIMAATIGFILLTGLGIWQLQRLKWKQDLLAQLAARMSATSVTIAEVEHRMSLGEDVEYLRVSAEGHFEHSNAQRMITAFAGGPGFIVVTPLILLDGRAILVDRGVVPESASNDFIRPNGIVSLSGIVRLHSSKPGFFDVRDENSIFWHYWEVPAMQSASNLPQATKWVPFVFQELPGGDYHKFPRPQEPKASLSNNHLGYALTWFGLAAVLAVMTVLCVLSQVRKPVA